MKNLRNVSVRGCVLFLLTIATPSLGVEEHGLLSREDFIHEAADHKNGPAMSSALYDPNPWASYNQWMCFDMSQVEVETVGVKFSSGWKPWPQFSAVTSGQVFVFSPETERELNVTPILGSWKNLIYQSRNICFYAAFLQYLDRENMSHPESLWILEDVKTESGYWHMADEIAIQERAEESSDDDEILVD